MYKKILLAMVMSVLSVCHSKDNNSAHNGFYFGYNLGYSSFGGNLVFNSSMTGKKQIISNIGTKSPSVGFFIGNGWSPFVKCIYLGYEIFANYEDINQRNSIIHHETIFDSNSSFGVVLKTGYIFKDYLFFVKKGFVCLKNLGENSPSRKKGMLLGFGMEYAISNNWSIGGDFVYEIYSSIPLQPNTLALPLYGNITYKPNKSSSNLRLKFTF